MTKDSKFSRWLAKNIMRWENDSEDYYRMSPNENLIHVMPIQAWCPRTSINQCKMLIKEYIEQRKLIDFVISFTSDASLLIQILDLLGETHYEAFYEYDDLEIGICEAIYFDFTNRKDELL